MAVRWRLALTGLLVSLMLHWFVLDGMRSSASAPQPGPILKAELRIPATGLPKAVDAESPMVTPHKDSVASIDKASVSPAVSAQTSVGAFAEPVMPSRVQTGELSRDEGVWRLMSDEELQAMARVRIAQALILDSVLITQPVILRIRRSPAGIFDLEFAEPGDPGPAAQRLREALLKLLGAKPGLLPDERVLPLDVEFQP